MSEVQEQVNYPTLDLGMEFDMPKDDFDFADPMELVGVALPE